MKLATTTALLLALATPTLAQTGLVEVNDDTMIEALGRDADDIEDMDVHDADNRKVGEVEEVVGEGPDAATALAVDFEDEIAGMGEEDRIVPLDQFMLDGDILRLDGDVAGMTDLPVWND